MNKKTMKLWCAILRKSVNGQCFDVQRVVAENRNGSWFVKVSAFGGNAVPFSAAEDVLLSALYDVRGRKYAFAKKKRDAIGRIHSALIDEKTRLDAAYNQYFAEINARY